ncbi:hypothetical protein R1X32_10770 (plasmid) [Rhodococcus opacus]|uniref:hypothetical protein n=1 Tax=Rhodococcus opacus TaxID=37919 RepID=UPI0034D293B7
MIPTLEPMNTGQFTETGGPTEFPDRRRPFGTAPVLLGPAASLSCRLGSIDVLV